nr:acetylornithine deacetylase [Roseospira goensis]
MTSTEMLGRLVGFDTTSRNSNLDLMAFVQDYLSQHGVASRLVPSEDGQKANLYATIGPTDRGGVMLSGHTDVVPVDGQDWHTDPFTLTERDGRLYGRGTTDMKGFVAVALAMVPDFVAAPLTTPVHLAFSYDEEVGCIGVRRLIDMLNGQAVRPSLCIVGEPTSMEVVIAHKGKRSYAVHVRGLEAHSSLAPRGVNAIEYAAELIAHMKGMARRLEADGPFDPEFDIPHTTIHVGTIQGGTALNIVPLDCRFRFEFRYLPTDDHARLLAEIQDFVDAELHPRMHAVDPSTGITITEATAFPALDTRADADVVAFAKALAGRNDHAKVAFGTEAGLFQTTADVPTVVCGPGSIAQAHKPNEFIEAAHLDRCEDFMRRLIGRLSGE